MRKFMATLVILFTLIGCGGGGSSSSKQCPAEKICPTQDICIEQPEPEACPTCPKPEACPTCPKPEACPVCPEPDLTRTMYGYLDDDIMDRIKVDEVYMKHYIIGELAEEAFAEVIEVNGSMQTKSNINLNPVTELTRHVLVIEFSQIR